MQAREESVDVNSFARRHIGQSEAKVTDMLSELGYESLAASIDAAVWDRITERTSLTMVGSARRSAHRTK